MQQRDGAVTTLIGEGTTVSGDVRFSGGLHLEGRIEGNLEAADEAARLDVSGTGSVHGEIHAATVVINGAVEGDIHSAGRLILGEKARIDGNVYYNVLEMAAGAAVNGKLVYRPESGPLALEHRKPRDAGEEDPGEIAQNAGQ